MNTTSNVVISTEEYGVNLTDFSVGNASNISRHCYAPDEDIYIEYRFITNGILLNIIGLLGILGNVISMIILSRPQMRSSINYLLIGLARIDTILIITSILLFGLPGVHQYTGYLFNYNYIVFPHLTVFIFPLATIAHTCSVYLTLTVSLERYVAVCHPLKARSLCTYGRAKLYFAGIIIFSLVYNLPRFWETAIQSEWIPELNVTVYCPKSTDFRESELYKKIYVHWCYLIFNYILPFSSIAILNAAIYRQVRKANRERQRLSRLRRREIGLATMLMCVVTVFFVCNLLPLVINAFETFNNEYYLYNLDPRIINTSNLIVTINSSVNFVIYVIFGEKFQRIFLVLFCNNSRFRPGRESPDGHDNDDSVLSNGRTTSLRLLRTSTHIRNGSSIRLTGKDSRITRSCSPGQCVYYPADQNQKELSIDTTQTFITE